jgi:C1A family cysteine protease
MSMLKRIAKCLFFLILLLLNSFHTDASKNELKFAPFKSKFLKYLEDVENGRYFSSLNGYYLGWTPPPVDLSHVKGTVNKIVRLSYPPSYDLRNLNKLTSVRSQGSCGSCWTFGTYSSLESTLMPAQQKDFSEQHLNANHGFDFAECAGGNAFMSTAYLARWTGPAAESDFPYPYAPLGIEGYALQNHIQQVIFLPERMNFLDNDTIKYFVTNYGAVYFAFRWNASYYNSVNHSYYYTGSDSANHAVAIVGWDDNYDKNNFNIAAPGNGAFIVRNSWGNTWGENGYFYISYYDNSLTEFRSFNNAEATNNYDKIYQYDPLGWSNSAGYGDTVAWAGNIFEAQDDKPLFAVSFYTTDLNVNVTIYIYKNVSGTTDPRNGSLAATKTGTFSYPGYRTVVLDSSVPLSSGEKFSVVIKVLDSSYIYPLALEDDIAGYSSSASANVGESFVSHSGTSWSDLGSMWNANACIKAFTKTPSYAPSTFYLDTDWNSIADMVKPYGGLSDVPISGDWDGDGDTDYGVYRPSNSTFYLDTNGDSFANIIKVYGGVGDVPVTGDWDGDGNTNYGVFRPSNCKFYLDTNWDSLANIVRAYGGIGDIPVTGDWNGDTITNYGIYRH